MTDVEMKQIKEFAAENKISIEEATEVYIEYFDQLDREMQETYDDIIRSTH